MKVASPTSPGRLSARVRPRRWMHAGENATGWLFAGPWIVGFVCFTAGPMAAAFVISFLNWSIAGNPTWAGLGNYQAMVHDPLFYNALRVTSLYALVAVPAQTVVAFLLAMLINNRAPTMGIFRTVFYFPSVLPLAAVALIFSWVFNPEWGVINAILGLAHIPGPPWLSSPAWALPTLILMSLWHVGVGMVIFLAGLQAVPRELLEAASIDGARWLRRTLAVTVPMVSPIIFFQVLINLIASLQVFVQPYIMTGGGPEYATTFMLLYIYQNAFQFSRMGYASALSWVLFLYSALITILALRLSRNLVHYEVGER